MKECGAADSTMESLPLMSGTGALDKEPTPLADLTGLSQLSQTADDAQIRTRYEHSRVTTVKSTPRVEPGPRSRRPRRLWAAVLGAAALSGAVGGVVSMSDPSQPPEAPLSITAPPPSMPVSAAALAKPSVAPPEPAAASATTAVLPEAAPPSAPVPARPADNGVASPSAASPAEPSMGSDLHMAHRGTQRIDVEDPYP
jgi:hypothetical protein